MVHFFPSLSFHSASSFLYQWPQLFEVQKLNVWRSLKQPLCSLKANSTMYSQMMRWHHCSLKAARSGLLRVYQHKMSITIAWRRRALHYSTVQEICFRFTATARDTDNTNTHTHKQITQGSLKQWSLMAVSLDAWSIMDGKTQSLNRNLENGQGLGLWAFAQNSPLPLA